jgi:hypothetical protein
MPTLKNLLLRPEISLPEWWLLLQVIEGHVAASELLNMPVTKQVFSQHIQVIRNVVQKHERTGPMMEGYTLRKVASTRFSQPSDSSA